MLETSYRHSLLLLLLQPSLRITDAAWPVSASSAIYCSGPTDSGHCLVSTSYSGLANRPTRVTKRTSYERVLAKFIPSTKQGYVFPPQSVCLSLSPSVCLV